MTIWIAYNAWLAGNVNILDMHHWFTRPHVRSLFARSAELVKANDEYNEHTKIYHQYVGIHKKHSKFHVNRFTLERVP